MDPSYNDDFGSFSNGQGGANSPIYGGGQQPSFSSAPTSGPVVLTPANNAKPRKGIRVLLAVLVLFVVVAGGVFALWKSGVLGGGDKEGRVLINKYISLLVSGKDSGEEIGGGIDVNSLFENEEDENTKNIYTSLRMFSYDSEENISYYSALKGALTDIGAIENSSDRWKKIVSWASGSKEMLSRYFVATFLADTDASYDYYTKNRNFDNFLSVYDFPFAKSKNSLMQGFDAIIDNTLYTKKEMYDEIMRLGCLLSTGIDYECLSVADNTKIELIQSDNLGFNDGVHNISLESLSLIINNANNIIDLLMGQNNE